MSPIQSRAVVVIGQMARCNKVYLLSLSGIQITTQPGGSRQCQKPHISTTTLVTQTIEGFILVYLSLWHECAPLVSRRQANWHLQWHSMQKKMRNQWSEGEVDGFWFPSQVLITHNPFLRTSSFTYLQPTSSSTHKQ